MDTKKKKNLKKYDKKKNKTVKNGGSFLYTTHEVEIYYPRKFLGKLLPSAYASKSEADAPSIEWSEIFNIPEFRFKKNGNYIIFGDIYDLSNNKKNVFIQQRIQRFLLPNINHTIKSIDVNKLNEFYKNIKEKTTKATTKLVFKIYSLGNYKHKLTLQQVESYFKISSSSNQRRSLFGFMNKDKSSTKKPIQITKDLVLQHIYTYYLRIKIK